jgi:hypothetical protein
MTLLRLTSDPSHLVSTCSWAALLFVGWAVAIALRAVTR